MTPNQHRKTRFIKGFTLIELLIVIAIIAILAAIAIPNYSDYVLKARRVDGMDAIMSLQLDQEKWRANHTTYGTLAELRGVEPLPSILSTDLYYLLTITSPNTTGYVITAEPQESQQKDGTCYTFVLTIAGGTPPAKSNLNSSDTDIDDAVSDRCWQR